MKIIFSGICMFISAFGIITMIFAALIGNKEYGALNGSTHMFVYLDWYGMTSIFDIFCFLGIVGLGIGLWGVFDRNNSK